VAHNEDTFHDLHWVDIDFVVVDIGQQARIDLAACNCTGLGPDMVHL
jgi:hypothetical protein